MTKNYFGCELLKSSWQFFVNLKCFIVGFKFVWDYRKKSLTKGKLSSHVLFLELRGEIHNFLQLMAEIYYFFTDHGWDSLFLPRWAVFPSYLTIQLRKVTEICWFQRKSIPAVFGVWTSCCEEMIRTNCEQVFLFQWEWVLFWKLNVPYSWS